MSTYFDIYFQGHNQQQRLRYRVIDTPVTDIWLKHVKLHIEKGYTIPPDVQWFYAKVSPERLQEIWQRLQKLCEDINNENLLEHDLYLANLEQCADLQLELNRLHYEFHHTKENQNKPSRATLLHMFNIEIHRAENILLNLSRQHSNLWGCFYLDNNSIPNVNIDQHSNLIEYWDHDIASGDLLLGYHTIGKNLYHCWTNNDIDLVKKRMLRPQDNISTEVILFFSNSTKSIPAAAQRQQMLDWVNQNKLNEYIDWQNPWHKIAGYPKLAENTDNLTYDEVNEIFETGHVFQVALEKQ